MWQKEEPWQGQKEVWNSRTMQNPGKVVKRLHSTVFGIPGGVSPVGDEKIPGESRGSKMCGNATVFCAQGAWGSLFWQAFPGQR